jgi:hypothetical protein
MHCCVAEATRTGRQIDCASAAESPPVSCCFCRGAAVRWWLYILCGCSIAIDYYQHTMN